MGTSTKAPIDYAENPLRIARLVTESATLYYILLDDNGIDSCTVKWGPFMLDNEVRGIITRVSYYEFTDNEVDYEELSDEDKAFVWELSLV